jgi:hypothetical protein
MTTELKPRAGTSVEDHLAELRSMSESSPAVARDAAWEWFRRLGRERATDRLDELFAMGRPPEDLDGPTDGILVMTQIHPLADPVINTLAAIQMPWMGKRFNRGSHHGDNRFISSARFPLMALWPRYSPKPSEDGTEGRLAFDFETRVEPSVDDPRTQVLVIDYDPVESNPDHLIRSIRDELVEIVPGANLGKIMHRNGDGGYRNWGFFALRPRGA